jgi:hypothetical protein
MSYAERYLNIKVLLKSLLQDEDFFLHQFEVLKRCLQPELDGASGVPHIMDDHVHEDAVGVDL